MDYLIIGGVTAIGTALGFGLGVGLGLMWGDKPEVWKEPPVEVVDTLTAAEAKALGDKAIEEAFPTTDMAALEPMSSAERAYLTRLGGPVLGEVAMARARYLQKALDLYRSGRHHSYAATGLANQPAASLLPEPTRCQVCGYTGYVKPGEPCPNCGD